MADLVEEMQEKIADVIWPLADWDGERTVAENAADKAAQACLAVVEKRIEELTRPIIGIENRAAQEAFDIMCDRIRAALPSVVLKGNSNG